MEFSRSIFVHCAVLVQPCHVVDQIYLGAEETACVRQDCSPGRAAQLGGLSRRGVRTSHALKLVNALFGVS